MVNFGHQTTRATVLPYVLLYVYRERISVQYDMTHGGPPTINPVAPATADNEIRVHPYRVYAAYYLGSTWHEEGPLNHPLSSTCMTGGEWSLGTPLRAGRGWCEEPSPSTGVAA